MSRRVFKEQQSAIEVDVSNLHKSFGSQAILKDVSFNVKASEIFVIMGPSGAGKSVLLKIIMGLMQADAGKVCLDGRDASSELTHQELITSIVFQAGALFNSLSVFENLALYLREHRMCSKKEIKSRVMQTLELLSLENAAFKMPSELSGGMRKRVAIARALMMEPQLLLYDEPTSELDPVTAAMIAELIGSLKDQYQVTSIVVSHDRDLSLTIGDRVAMMFDGRIHAMGTPDEMRSSEDPLVNDFLNPKIDVLHPRFKKTSCV